MNPGERRTPSRDVERQPREWREFERNPALAEALEDDCTDWDPYDIEGWEEGIGHG